MDHSRAVRGLRGLNVSTLGVPTLLLAILSMLIIPLPPILLDIFFTFNIALSVGILMVIVYTLRPLDFSVFPTVLLIATLLRLALNVASTRAILLEGHTGNDAAGQVIQAFGEFVIGGNYAVGLIVFMVFIIINFVVVTKGTGRVAEVSARFTLDAMPGKQMAIDADLNAGLISQDEARQRRKDVSMEADFYGAMDGSSKFVRGDAIAGILILVINIIGGFAIGIGQHGLSMSQAVENYTLLTIGDGLVAQIPSLLLSTATAIIVTRVTDAQDIGASINESLVGDSRVLYVSSGVIGLLGLIPGMPNFAFLSIASVIAYLAYRVSKKEDGRTELLEDVEIKKEETVIDVSWDDVRPVDLISLEVGYRLIPMVDKEQGGELLGRIKGIRKKIFKELGFLPPPVHVLDSLDLAPNAYQIYLKGVSVGQGSIHPDREMAIDPGDASGDLSGVSGFDPVFNLKAIWISPEERAHAQTLGYNVVDAATVVSTHIHQVIFSHASELLGHEEIKELMDRITQISPKLAEALAPETLPVVVMLKVLQNLLEERIPIKDIRTIAQVLAEESSKSQDPDVLTMAVRRSMGRLIVQQTSTHEDELPVITLTPDFENILSQSVKNSTEDTLALEPGLAEHFIKSLTEVASREEMRGNSAILLVSPMIRRAVAKWLKFAAEGLHVLAYTEIPAERSVRVVAAIGGENRSLDGATDKTNIHL